jgi:hypothetical protein
MLPAPRSALPKFEQYLQEHHLARNSTSRTWRAGPRAISTSLPARAANAKTRSCGHGRHAQAHGPTHLRPAGTKHPVSVIAGLAWVKAGRLLHGRLARQQAPPAVAALADAHGVAGERPRVDHRQVPAAARPALKRQAHAPHQARTAHDGARAAKARKLASAAWRRAGSTTGGSGPISWPAATSA